MPAAFARAQSAYYSFVRARRRSRVTEAHRFCEQLVTEGRMTRPQARTMALPVLLRANDLDLAKRRFERLPVITKLAEANGRPIVPGPGAVAAAAKQLLADPKFFQMFPSAAASVAKEAVQDSSRLSPEELQQRIDQLHTAQGHTFAGGPHQEAALKATFSALGELHGRAVGRRATIRTRA